MAPKRPLPFILPASLHEGARNRVLKRHKIKPSNIARRYEADGSILYIPTKKSFFNLPKEMIPSREKERRIRLIDETIAEYKAMVETERRAEMAAQKAEIASMSGPEREFFGRAVLGLKGRGVGRRFELWVVRFGRDRAIETEISGGDLVLVSRGEPLKSDLTGTVMGVAKQYVEVAFEQRPPRWIKEGGVRLDLYVNDVTFKRMEANLEALRHAGGETGRMRDILFGLESACAPAAVTFTPQNGLLNAAQKRAVAGALGCRDIALIHGPPGTGKTTTLIEAIVQFIGQGKRVLASADSNVAVDNMLRALIEKEGLKVVRVGHPARIDEKLGAYSLLHLASQDPRAKQVRAMLEEANALVEARNAHSKPTPARLRGMSREQVRRLAKEGRSMRGVDAKTIASMARWIEEDEKVTRFFEAIRELERAIEQEILEGADVVLATNGMIGSESMEGLRFDVAAVDEAGQQILPSTLMALARAPIGVLAGDHRQLPPTVLSNLPELEVSLFERLKARRDVTSFLLDTQYRMHETIMDFPNRLMYGGALRAHESVAKYTLKTLAKLPAPLCADRPVVFVDTGRGEERKGDRTASYENVTEAELITEWVASLTTAGVASDAIGVITPYRAQVKRMKRLLEEKDLSVEVKSVDGFQGREKEVIFISLVRSNEEGNVGFLKDARRLNVAMTRARAKLVMVGDLKTLKQCYPFDRLALWLKEKGALYEPEAAHVYAGTE